MRFASKIVQQKCGQSTAGVDGWLIDVRQFRSGWKQEKRPAKRQADQQPGCAKQDQFAFQIRRPLQAKIDEEAKLAECIEHAKEQQDTHDN